MYFTNTLFRDFMISLTDRFGHAGKHAHTFFQLSKQTLSCVLLCRDFVDALEVPGPLTLS